MTFLPTSYMHRDPISKEEARVNLLSDEEYQVELDREQAAADASARGTKKVADGLWITQSETVERIHAHLPVDRLKYSEDQPRDDHGRFSSGGGGDGSDASHPIVTSDVNVAAKALGEGKFVQLDQPRSVSTLLDKLAQNAQEAKSLGQKAPVYDLGKVSVPGTNLFTAENVGVSRVDMPQLTGVPAPGSPADSFPKDAKGEVDLSGAFANYLAASGVGVSSGVMTDASYLRASQMELDGAKVGGMMRAIDAGVLDPSTRSIWTTRDDYVVDGHHLWAATVGDEFKQGAQIFMNTNVIDMSIVDALKMAQEFTVSMGIGGRALGKARKIADGLYLVKYSEDQPRDEHGRFGSSSGTFTPITAADLANQSGNNSREVSPEEFQQIAAAGQARIDAFAANTSPPTGLDQNWKQIVSETQAAVQVPWGGITVDAHTGATVTTGYAVTAKEPGMSTIVVSLSDAADPAKFAAAMDQARSSFDSVLQQQGAALGAFHDANLNEVHIDPAYIVDSQQAVEEIGAATHSTGGGYSFADGNGYWAPHVP